MSTPAAFASPEDPPEALLEALPDVRPRFPTDRGGVAILGCGTIAQAAHLPAYAQHDVDVVGVWSRNAERTAGIRDRFPGVRRVYATAEDLLADPEVRIVDLATGPEGRMAWIEAAVAAGKHVLAQKPLTLDADELAALPELTARAEARGLRIAVNQNARWAPVWRLATLLVRDGTVGDVVGVTHLHDKPLPPLAGTPFDDLPHMLLTDYLLHWVDITCSWLEASPVTWVQAVDSRVPGQPAAARNPWAASLSLVCADGATASMRVVGDVRASEPGCPFWIHGTRGSLRGSILLGSDRLTLDRGEGAVELPVPGEWFVDGFAGAMAELMAAVAEGREPEHSAERVAGSLRVLLAGRESAEREGRPVLVEPAGRSPAPLAPEQR